MPTLIDLAAEFPTDKLGHGYLPHYEGHLGHLRHKPISLIEIGIQRGGSLRMWAEFFWQARVVGVDIDPACREAAGGHIEVVIGDIKGYVPDREFDVVIDDGSHQPEDVIAAFELLWPRLRPGGWYVIEDLMWMWVAHFGGGPEGSALRPWLHGLFDLVLLGRPCSKWRICEVHLHPQIAFIRKTEQCQG